MKISNIGIKGQKIIMGVGIFIAIVLVLLGIYYFRNNWNYTIYSDSGDLEGNTLMLSATDIVYYGPDIGYDSDFDYENDDWFDKGVHPYSGMEYTNGIICIYTLSSKWDRKNTDRSYLPLYIVGNVYRVSNEYSNSDIEYFNNEIDKRYYKDYWDSYYDY